MKRALLPVLCAAGLASATLAFDSLLPHLATEAHAQMPSLGSFGQNMANQAASGQGSATGLLGGLAGNALPSLGNASSGNVAGVLTYCVNQNAVSSTTASTTANALSNQGNISNSSEYQNGAQGLLQTGSGNSFSLSSLSAPLKQRLCNAVLSRAKSML